MCGIAGIVNLDKRSADRRILKSMSYAHRHRGPDDEGIYASGQAGLSHVRLSIIDLSKQAAQPMSNEALKVIIVHNGEIYNYLEIRDELKRLGRSFRSSSDTEVILLSYEEWGENCLSRFNGMWSFAILDLRKGILFCSRDRLGVKPFYYYLDENVFVFSSEIKSLLEHPDVKRRPNDSSIYNYLASGYGYMDTSDETFFDGIRQLKPGHYIRLSLKDNKFSQNRYWDIDPARKAVYAREEDVCEKFLELFRDSVKLRLRSDVPLGVSLSGGLDSSSIACVAKEILGGIGLETFSSCYDDERYDERQFIKTVVDKTGAKANLIFTKPERLFDEIEEIIWHQDEPYSTLSIFPQWYIMKLAKERGIKVLLNGQGGDEVLGGYHKYYLYLFADLICSFRWGNAAKEMKLYREMTGNEAGIAGPISRIILSYGAPAILKKAINLAAMRSRPDYLNKDFVAGNANRVFTNRKFGSILNNDLYNALRISPLPSLLHIDDRSGMAHAVESRAPFLDYRLVEYAFSLGPEFKIRDGLTKYLLRRSMKGTLPREILCRRDKMGFATPLEKWFSVDLKDKVHDIFNSKEFALRPYFDRKKVLEKFDNFTQGREKNVHYAIWSWINLELWLRKFIDGK